MNGRIVYVRGRKPRRRRAITKAAMRRDEQRNEKMLREKFGKPK